LPLFPTETFGPILSRGESRMPGNTIRKVYLCRAKTTRIKPGDVLFFYMSKDEGLFAGLTFTSTGAFKDCSNPAWIEALADVRRMGMLEGAGGQPE
jgi:hypothetical protein